MQTTNPAAQNARWPLTTFRRIVPTADRENATPEEVTTMATNMPHPFANNE
jgi:hypothetical protein